MSKVLHVDGYVNLSPLGTDEFSDWTTSAHAEKEIATLIRLVEEESSPKEIQRTLLDFETKIADRFDKTVERPKDVRLEVHTDKGYVTLGWFDNGQNASCYVRNETFREQ